MGQLGWVWFGGAPLPFYIAIFIDNSGSLTTQQVPQVFNGITLIRDNLLTLGTLTEDQKNTFVPYQGPGNERYLSWMSTLVTQLKPPNATKCVTFAWIDESEPIYHAGSNSLRPGFVTDLATFSNFVSSNTIQLLGGKIFAVREEPSSFQSFQGFLEHLNAAFTIASPPLSSFQNIYQEQMLTYEVTIDRQNITLQYAYNLMANYLNTFFEKEEFDLLPLL